MKAKQSRSCPICKKPVHWGRKTGHCKCPGKNWQRRILGAEAQPAAAAPASK